MVASVWELAGYPVEITDWYSAWTPNPEFAHPGSDAVHLPGAVWRGAEVGAVHAGLECGTFSSKYPGIDMISIGPTLTKVHSPSERLHIPSVAKVMDLLAATLQAIPEK